MPHAENAISLLLKGSFLPSTKKVRIKFLFISISAKIFNLEILVLLLFFLYVYLLFTSVNELQPGDIDIVAALGKYFWVIYEY